MYFNEQSNVKFDDLNKNDIFINKEVVPENYIYKIILKKNDFIIIRKYYFDIQEFEEETLLRREWNNYKNPPKILDIRIATNVENSLKEIIIELLFMNEFNRIFN